MEITFFFFCDALNVLVQMRERESEGWKRSQSEGWREKGGVERAGRNFKEDWAESFFHILFSCLFYKPAELCDRLYEFVIFFSLPPWTVASSTTNVTYGVTMLDQCNNTRVVTFYNSSVYLTHNNLNIVNTLLTRLYVNDFPAPLQSNPVWYSYCSHLFPRLLFSPNGWCSTWLPLPLFMCSSLPSPLCGCLYV